MSDGKKYDNDKPRMSLVPTGVLFDTIKVLEFGAKKYGADNWKKVEDAERRYYDALQRHIEAWRNGENIDPESGMPHLSHAACCIMFLQYLSGPHHQQDLEEIRKQMFGA